MKILHLLDERWDSGLTAYGLAAARALRARGHEVHVAARDGLAAAVQSAAEGFPLLSLGSLPRFLREVRAGGFQVVNAHTGRGHSVGWLAARWAKAILVRTRGEARRLSVRPGQGFLFRRTDAVIAASRVLADAYGARFPFLQDRLSVVYPGVAIAPLVLPATTDPFRAGILGRLDPVKGHRFFLEAVAQLKDQLTDQEFVIAGEDKGVSRSDLERRAAELGVSRWVRFLGRVPDAGGFMDACHVGVVASLDSEAVSRAGLEWLAHGRPLVTTAVGALPEMVVNGDNGFVVPPRNASGLARTLKVLMEDPFRREKMGARARAVAEARFSLAQMGQETERVYENALARRWGRP